MQLSYGVHNIFACVNMLHNILSEVLKCDSFIRNREGLKVKKLFIFLYIDSPQTIMQMMTEVIILGCIYALPANRDLMRAEGPKHIPIF